MLAVPAKSFLRDWLRHAASLGSRAVAQALSLPQRHLALRRKHPLSGVENATGLPSSRRTPNKVQQTLMKQLSRLCSKVTHRHGVKVSSIGPPQKVCCILHFTSCFVSGPVNRDWISQALLPAAFHRESESSHVRLTLLVLFHAITEAIPMSKLIVGVFVALLVVGAVGVGLAGTSSSVKASGCCDCCDAGCACCTDGNCSCAACGCDGACCAKAASCSSVAVSCCQEKTTGCCPCCEAGCDCCASGTCSCTDCRCDCSCCGVSGCCAK